jgi:hypothetical protein
MTHENLYATLLKHAFTYDVCLLRKLARLLSYSETCVYDRNIEHTYTCIDVSRDTRLKKSIRKTRTLAGTHVPKDVLLHEITLAETHA